MLKSLYLVIKKSFKTKIQLLLEIAMLAKQLEIYQRTDPKLKIKRTDRMFYSLIMDLLINWKERIFIVKPNTMIKWHREGFRIYWKSKSKAKRGRPRIHGELKKLGFDISESTVQRYMPKKGKRTTGQNWKTFLKNHATEIISLDFLTVPTINFKLIYVLVIIEHHRRKIIHLNVTKNPTVEWILQQLRNLAFDNTVPKYLIRDRDTKFGKLFSNGIKQFGINPIVTAYRSPWQNGYVERVIGSIKRECLDHIIVLNENHLRSVLNDYISYYNKYRPHLGINKDSPEGRPVQSEGEFP
jgi:putative transposase